MRIDTLAIIGVGLIGGSIGLAARRRGFAQHVIGVGRNLDALQRAQAQGAIDECQLDVIAAVRQANLAIFCTPVERIAEQVLAAAPHCAPGTLFTDAGSAKAVIVQTIEGRLPESVSFVGSHPLAGSEKRGSEHADANLFRGRVTVVTPTLSTPETARKETIGFWEALGAHVCLMTPEDHDAALALTSHLPHLVASALAGVLPPELHLLTATGFRDTTRVAAGDPALWTGILLQNRSKVLEAIDKLYDRLAEFKQAITAQDSAALDNLLAEGKKVRDALGSSDRSERRP